MRQLQINFRHKTFLLFASALLTLSISSSAIAASAFSVSPTRLDVSAKKRTTELRVKNKGNKPVTVKLSVKTWEQVDGKSVTKPTRDIVFTPPIASIPPRSEKVVRFKFKRPIDKNKELAYRVYSEQLPSALDQEGQSAKNEIRIRFSVPLFVKQLTKPVAKVNYNASVLSNGQLQLDLQNLGNFHLKANNIAIFPGSIERGRLSNSDKIAITRSSTTSTNYILPGSTQQFILSPDPGKTIQTGDHILVATDYLGSNLNNVLQHNGYIWLEVK